MKKNLIFNIILFLLASILFIFIIFPLIKAIFSTDIKTLINTLQDNEVIKSISLSLQCATIATFIAFIIGIPVSYIFARYNFIGKSLLESLIDIPVMIPHTAAGIALLTVFGDRFIFGKLFGIFGISFTGTKAGIFVGMMFVSLSYFVNSTKEGIKKVDIKLENVARTLGASKFRVFTDITLPLIKKDILSGAIMMWARGISEFGAVVILAYHPMTAPVFILERFNSFGLSYSRPVAVILIVICIILFMILRFINNKKR